MNSNENEKKYEIMTKYENNNENNEMMKWNSEIMKIMNEIVIMK